MIIEVMEAWNNAKGEIRGDLTQRGEIPYSWQDFAAIIVGHLAKYLDIDPERVEVIDHGDYQGTLLFVIGTTGYQPSEYWVSKVSYGSCSGCDALQDVADRGDVDDAMQLALGFVEGFIRA